MRLLLNVVLGLDFLGLALSRSQVNVDCFVGDAPHLRGVGLTSGPRCYSALLPFALLPFVAPVGILHVNEHGRRESDDAALVYDAFGVFGTALREKIGVFHSSYLKMDPKTPNAS
jgi:hypothetical protein